MKVVKELPLSIYQSVKFSLTPSSFLRGLNKEVLPVIVSLTSIPSRLGTLHLVIKSILNQDKLPKKIILWLNESLKNELPKNLKKIESDIFEIHYSKLNCSHRKLIHTLEIFPDDCIVTCDDDLMYRKYWLSTIYKEHLLNPTAVIGNHTSHINHDEYDNPLPFKKWRNEFTTVKNSKALVPIGAWGVLYPPKSLDEKVTNVEEFMLLAPKADDLWFKAMALLKGTLSLQAIETPKEPVPIIGSQKIALKKENLDKDKNTVQWNALNEKYNLNTLILSK